MPPLRHARSLLALAALSLLPALTAGAQAVGWTVTLRMDTDSGRGAANRTSTVMRYQTLSDRYRTEYVQATGAMGAVEGSYQIFNASDSTMTMVLPAHRMATVTPMTGMIAKVSEGMPTPGATHISRSDVTDLGAGPKIAGHATRHFRTAMSGTIDWSTPDRTCVQPLDDETEVWIATDVDIGAAAGAMGAFLSAAAAGGHASTGAQIPKGAALRTITRVQRTDATGVKHSIATTMEVIDLARGPIPASAFLPPPDYKVMDMGKIMASVPREMLDSAIRSAPQHVMDALCGGTH